MAITNFTDDGEENTFEQLVCSVELTGGIHRGYYTATEI